MPVPPRPPGLQAAAQLADHKQKIRRLEGSRDQHGSTLSKHTADIAAATATANSAQSGVTAINARLGSADMAFLAALGEMSHINNALNSFSHSGVGTLASPPTAAEFNSLNTAFNNLVDGVNALVAKYNSLLAELQASNYMH